MTRPVVVLVFLCSLFFQASFFQPSVGAQDAQSELDLLKAFLKQSPANEVAAQAFAQQPLTKKLCVKAQTLIWDAHVANIKQERADEWEAKSITLGKHTMKFDYRVFGRKPKNGRSLFISMHGGGSAPARVNEQQWKNQIKLYKPKEGIYLAPRAPTDTWNLWHEPHIDQFFTRIIEDAVLIAEVDPNRVYIMGYSAGGDGVYQLGPRMADRFAAAAMMAGHPNDAQPFGLRNIGFTIHVGGKDTPYNRHKKAANWKRRLAELQKADPKGYQHEVTVHPQHAHWMNLDDAVAVPWMSKFTRNPFPDKVVWYQSGVTTDRFYWLAVDDANRKPKARLEVVHDGQNFVVEAAEEISEFKILLNDQMIDFDKPVVVSRAGKELYRGKPKRTIAVLGNTITDRGDPVAVYSAEIVISLPSSDLPASE